VDLSRQPLAVTIGLLTMHSGSPRRHVEDGVFCVELSASSVEDLKIRFHHFAAGSVPTIQGDS
jgi:hypothetical protein